LGDHLRDRLGDLLHVDFLAPRELERCHPRPLVLVGAARDQTYRRTVVVLLPAADRLRAAHLLSGPAVPARTFDTPRQPCDDIDTPAVVRHLDRICGIRGVLVPRPAPGRTRAALAAGFRRSAPHAQWASCPR